MDHNWKEVAPIDLLKVTKLEGQPWLGLYALIGNIWLSKYFSFYDIETG